MILWSIHNSMDRDIEEVSAGALRYLYSFQSTRIRELGNRHLSPDRWLPP